MIKIKKKRKSEKERERCFSEIMKINIIDLFYKCATNKT